MDDFFRFVEMSEDAVLRSWIQTEQSRAMKKTEKFAFEEEEEESICESSFLKGKSALYSFTNFVQLRLDISEFKGHFQIAAFSLCSYTSR
jgi:hypothetical protein